MSADLWKEFGSPDREYIKSPCGQQPDINLQTKKPDVESPDALLLQVSEPHEGSNTDAGSTFDAHGNSKYRDQSTKAAYKSQPSELSSLGKNVITDQTSTIDKSRQATLREFKSFGAVPTTSEYSHTSGQKVTPLHTNAQTLDEDDEWGDFVEGINPESAESSAVKRVNPPRIESGDDIPAPACLNSTLGQLHLPEKESTRTVTMAVPSKENDSEQLMRASIQGPSPSNIPPPSILLRLISSIFQSLSSDIKKYNLYTEPFSHTSSSAHQRLITNLRRKLAIIRASARIIAGRKLRWGRDTHLSQSMKIGPAQGGRAGGMKLTVLDKAETRREDREVEEAIRTWKQRIGSLRALLVAISTQASDHTLANPELAEKMPVRLAKLSEGGITASKGCFLCGLKRDERVEKVDIQVEDSFGEWWIDHWGHVDCVIFWQEQKDHLQQR